MRRAGVGTPKDKVKPLGTGVNEMHFLGHRMAGYDLQFLMRRAHTGGFRVGWRVGVSFSRIVPPYASLTQLECGWARLCPHHFLPPDREPRPDLSPEPCREPHESFNRF